MIDISLLLSGYTRFASHSRNGTFFHISAPPCPHRAATHRVTSNGPALTILKDHELMQAPSLQPSLLSQQAPQARRDGVWHVDLRGDTSKLQAAVMLNCAVRGEGRGWTHPEVWKGGWADVVAMRSGVTPLGLQPMRRTAFTFQAHSSTPRKDIAGLPMVCNVDETWCQSLPVVRNF